MTKMSKNVRIFAYILIGLAILIPLLQIVCASSEARRKLIEPRWLSAYLFIALLFAVNVLYRKILGRRSFSNVIFYSLLYLISLAVIGGYFLIARYNFETGFAAYVSLYVLFFYTLSVVGSLWRGER